jgi:uncharacterized protein YehS (DUF1456 family)
MNEIFKLSFSEINMQHLQNFLKKDDEPGFMNCPDFILNKFLDGLILLKRGKKENAPENEKRPDEKLSNNVVLKKIRIALELKDDDIQAILTMGNFEISKSELSALFRREGQKNYKECGDQLLRKFLKGLTLRMRK